MHPMDGGPGVEQIGLAGPDAAAKDVDSGDAASTEREHDSRRRQPTVSDAGVVTNPDPRDTGVGAGYSLRCPRP